MSKKEVRAARQAALAAKKERERRLRLGAIVGGGILIGAAIIWMVASIARRPAEVAASDPNVTATEITVDEEDARHIPAGQRAVYNHYPPSSGQHWSQSGLAPAATGFYEEPLPPEVWVHNLEHGYVVVLYNCPEACPDTVEALRDFANSVPASRFGNQKLVVTSDPAITAPIITLAWTRQLDLSDFDEARLVEFYRRWVDSGPELIP